MLGLYHYTEKTQGIVLFKFIVRMALGTIGSMPAIIQCIWVIQTNSSDNSLKKFNMRIKQDNRCPLESKTCYFKS